MAKKAARAKMAAGTRKPARTAKPTEDARVAAGPARVLDPAEVHALLGLPAPYNPPPPPPPADGYATFWDPGLSVNERRRHRALFYLPDALATEAFARQSETWAWRQLKLVAAGPGRSFAEQSKDLAAGAELPPVRPGAGRVPRHPRAGDRGAAGHPAAAVPGRPSVGPPGHRGAVPGTRHGPR